MNVYIIDDEKAPRLILKHLLAQLNSQTQVIGESNSLIEGIQDIKKNNLAIDVLFLDIEMPEKSGLEIRSLIKDSLDFHIVFVTAYSQYAIDAFKLSAFDYLLKPVKANELEACLIRLTSAKTKLKDQLALLSKNLSNDEEKVYLVRTHKEEYFIKISTIISLEADGMYTHIHLENKKITASKPLKEILNDLPNFFFRTHRSFAVNIYNMEKPIRISNGQIISKTGLIPISQRRKAAFLDEVKKTNN